MEAEWRIYASVNYTNIGSGNGLSPGRRQAIIWTNAGILLIGPVGTNFGEIVIEIKIFSFTHLHLKVSSAKVAAILSRPQCVNREYLVSITVKPDTTCYRIMISTAVWWPSITAPRSSTSEFGDRRLRLRLRPGLGLGPLEVGRNWDDLVIPFHPTPLTFNIERGKGGGGWKLDIHIYHTPGCISFDS